MQDFELFLKTISLFGTGYSLNAGYYTSLGVITGRSWNCWSLRCVGKLVVFDLTSTVKKLTSKLLNPKPFFRQGIPLPLCSILLWEGPCCLIYTLLHLLR